MATRRTLQQVKAEKATRKKKAIRRKRILVLVIEIVILLVLLGIGYLMKNPGVLIELGILGNI